MSWSPRWVHAACVLTLLCLLAGILVLSAGVVTAQDGGADWGGETNVSMTVQLQADGDAHWVLTTTLDLQNEEEIEAYRSMARDFEAGDLPALGVETFEVGLESANGNTDREMAITAVERDTSSESEISDGSGRFTVEFTWENFAQVEDGTVTIDRDVLVTDSGEPWLGGLDESWTLRIVAPPEYDVRDANVGPQNGELVWTGPVEFSDTTLQATFSGPGPENGDDDGNGTTDPNESESEMTLWPVVGLFVAGLAVAVFLVRFDRAKLDIPAGLALPVLSRSEKEENGPESSSAEHDGGESAAPDEIDAELLSDEERVERLLESNGGRMKQADIVTETDWSNAKVSQLLSSMEEDGRIDKLRIGRENLISFPDQDVTAIDED